MSRKKSSPIAGGSPDPEEFGDTALNRKQVLDLLRRKESLDDADLRGTDLSGVVFDGASLRQAKFAEANLTRASFRGADLRGASLFAANLKDACFDGANLEDADLDYAFLDGATVHGAQVKKALFPTRKLPLADVRAAVASGARLRMEPFGPDDDDD